VAAAGNAIGIQAEARNSKIESRERNVKIVGLFRAIFLARSGYRLLDRFVSGSCKFISSV